MDQHQSQAATFEAFDDCENIGSNPAPDSPIGEIIEARYGRRALLGSAATLAALSAGLPRDAEAQSAVPVSGGPSSLTFSEPARALAQRESVAEGYEVQTIIRWGDPILPGAPAFEAGKTTPAAQARQFGYNNDYLDFFPLPQGATGSDHGLLVVNHEYTNPGLMWGGLGSGSASRQRVNAEQAEAEIMAHGLSVVEIRKENGRWGYAKESRFNRRITAATPMQISGPAAGHDLLKTKADPTGRQVLGTLNNCAGGNTPWGTVLTAEENFNLYFGGDIAKTPHAESFRRYGIRNQASYSWPNHIDRFNVEKEPNEAFRFGWIVEIDPYDPNAVPVKRTALGRFKHEGCHHAINADGRVVIYMAMMNGLISSIASSPRVPGIPLIAPPIGICWMKACFRSLNSMMMARWNGWI